MITDFLSLANCNQSMPGNDLSSEFRHLHEIDILSCDTNQNFVVLVRDPRDQLVSLASWRLHSWSLEHSDLSDSEILKLKAKGIDEQVNELLEWSFSEYKKAKLLKEKLPENVYILKYEDIASPQFGGSPKKVQSLALHKLVELCGGKISDHDIDQFLARGLKIPRITFSSEKQKVGQWKFKLLPKTVKRIEKLYGEYMDYFGYSKKYIKGKSHLIFSHVFE